MQIDLGQLFRVCAFATQGNLGENKEYLKEYKLEWSRYNANWETSAKVWGMTFTRCSNLAQNTALETFAIEQRYLMRGLYFTLFLSTLLHNGHK